MIEIGRIVVKIAGRDAGKKAVVVDILDDTYILLDGETRRRKCNVLHVEPLKDVIKIEKNASHSDVTAALKEIGIEVRNTKPKQKAVKSHDVKEAPAEKPKKAKSEKKTVKKATEKKAVKK